MEIGSNTPAIVTGGGSGLGAAVARHLSSLGAPVTVMDRDAEAGQAVAQEIDGHFLSADISAPDSVIEALDQARSLNGIERITVNCAGIAPSAKTVSRGAAHDPELFAKVIAINLCGSFTVSSQSAAAMAQLDPLGKDGERGVIINTASVAAYEGQIGQVAYAASKAGVAGMTLPLARDLSKLGIRALGIAPGIFMTPMVSSFPEEVQDALAAVVPFPERLGDPTEFACLVAHCVENNMLNGEVIRIDGAIRMPPR